VLRVSGPSRLRAVNAGRATGSRIEYQDEQSKTTRKVMEKKLRKYFGEKLLLQEDLSRHCHYRIGGRARFYLRAANEEDLVTAFELSEGASLQTFVLGKGTNVLFSDRGYDGMVIDLTGSFNTFSRRGDAGLLVAGAGAALQEVIDFSIEESLGGLEKLSGIPGSVGGALKMNAGSYGTEIKETLLSARVLGPDRRFREIPLEELGLGYRSSSFQGIAVEALFKLRVADRAELRETRRRVLASRMSRHPLEFPSAGSFFKKTAAGVSAGELIDKAGFKGKRVGNAVISELHANFILNVGGASARDVVKLARMAQEEVERKFSVLLVPEVVFVGFQKTGYGGLPEV